MASSALVALEEDYRRVSLPLLALAPRVKGMSTWVRGSSAAFTNDPGERFAVGVFLYAEGELVWGGEERGVAHGDLVDLRVPEATVESDPGVLFIYATKQVYLDGEPVPRKRFEETWVFLASEERGSLAVSIPAVPYIGSLKPVIDNHYLCFPGVRMVRGVWSSTAYVINPYPDQISMRCWLQATDGKTGDVPAASAIPPKSVRAVELPQSFDGSITGNPERFDYGTLVVWCNLKPQGFVAIRDGSGRTRAMDHFHPFWRS